MPRALGRIATIEVSDDAGTTWEDLGCTVDLALNSESESVDDTCRDDGAYRSKLNSYLSGAIPFSGRWVEEDAGQLLVVTAHHAQTEISVRFRPHGADSGQYEYECLATIPTLNITPSIDGSLDYDGNFELTSDYSPSAQV